MKNVDDKLREQVLDLLKQNRKLEAIKLVFETLSCGLKVAKDLVDEIEKTSPKK